LYVLEIPPFESKADDPQKDDVTKVDKAISKEHRIFSGNLNMTKYVRLATKVAFYLEMLHFHTSQLVQLICYTLNVPIVTVRIALN